MRADASQCQDLCIYGGIARNICHEFIFSTVTECLFTFFLCDFMTVSLRWLWHRLIDRLMCVEHGVPGQSRFSLRREWRKYISISFICRTQAAATTSKTNQSENICLILVISELLERNWLTAGWKFAAKMPDHIHNRLSSFITINCKRKKAWKTLKFLPSVCCCSSLVPSTAHQHHSAIFSHGQRCCVWHEPQFTSHHRHRHAKWKML